MNAPATSVTAAAQWSAALENMAQDLERAGYATGTCERVVKHLRKYAAETSPAGPWDATSDQVTDWLDRLPCTEQARYGYRTSLRTFYRWAYRAGRVYTDPTELVTRRATAATVPDLWHLAITDYGQHLRAAGIPRSTIQLRRHQLGRLARQLGARDPWAVTLGDLTDWLARHRWARETMRSHRSAVRAFYAWAADTGRVDSSPADRLPVVRAGAPAPRPTADDEYAAALAAAEPREALMLRLSAELGLRRAEVAGCHSRDLTNEPDGAWLTVHGKGDKTRRVPLTSSLAAAIRQRGQGWLFPGQDSGHLSPAYVGRRVSQLLPTGVTMHSLRHRFATRAYQVDRDVFSVQQLLGHASPQTTQRYVQVPSDNLRRLVGLV